MGFPAAQFRPVELITTFDGGANTRDLPEAIARNQSPFPLNVELRGGRWRKLPGYKALGTDSDDGSAGWTLFNHRILSDEEVMVKTISTKLKYYDEVTSAFHLLTDATFTAGLRWWFDTFNGYLYGGNGTDNMVRWRGSSWSTLATAVTGASTEIVLAAGEGARFASSGSGMIESDTFAWTGRSTDTLTGVTGLSSNHTIGARVIEKLDSTTYSSQPKGSVGAIFKNRLFVRDDSSANFLYFSKLADNTAPHDDLANFTIAGTGAGDAGFIIFPAAIRGVRKFIDGGNNAIFLVFCADGEAYSVTVTDTAGSPGTTAGLYVPYKNLNADLAGIGMVTSTENEIIVVDHFGTMRAMGYGEQSTAVRTVRLSDIIGPTVEPSNLDFSSGALRYAGRKVMAIGKLPGATYNNFIVVKDTDPDAFSFVDYVSLNDVVEWKNAHYGINAVLGTVYELFTGRSAAGNDIKTVYPMPKLNHGVELVHKVLRKIRIKGKLTKGCLLYLDIYFDDDVKARTFLIDGSNASIVDADNPAVAIGTVVFGQAPQGDTAEIVDDLRPFTATINLPPNRLYYHIKPVWRNTQSEVDCEVHAMLFYAEAKDPDIEIANKQLGIS